VKPLAGAVDARALMGHHADLAVLYRHRYMIVIACNRIG